MFKKPAIIIPYKNRKPYLDIYLDLMPKYLEENGISEFKIYVSEQADDKIFNAGTSRNVAALYALREFPYDYLIFSDVDIIPVRNVDLSLPKHDTIWFMNAGSAKILSSSFKKVNGYNNHFVGWGYEDSEFWHRLKTFGIKYVDWARQPSSKMAVMLNLESNTVDEKECLEFSKFYFHHKGDGPKFIGYPMDREAIFHKRTNWYSEERKQRNNRLKDWVEGLRNESAKNYFGFFGANGINLDAVTCKSDSSTTCLLQYDLQGVLLASDEK